MHLSIHKLLLWIQASQQNRHNCFIPQKTSCKSLKSDRKMLRYCLTQYECWWCAQFNVQFGRYPPNFLFQKVHPHHLKIRDIVRNANQMDDIACNIVQTGGLFCKRDLTWWQIHRNFCSKRSTLIIWCQVHRNFFVLKGPPFPRDDRSNGTISF